MVRDEIIALINEALKDLELGASGAKWEVEHPADMSHGDYSTNVAMIIAKKSRANPRELADRIASKLEASCQKLDAIEKVEVAGPGFINFFLSPKFFEESLEEILGKGDKFGTGDFLKGKKYVVEYSSPNIAKPFTIGHLRSTIIGDAVANLVESQGAEVIRDNHLGDWGTQFGKQIVAIKRWGNEKDIDESENPVKELVALYVKFHDEAEKDEKLGEEGREWFAKLEAGDAEARRLWKKCVLWSMKEFNKTYERLGIRFDTYIGESTFEDKLTGVIKMVEVAGVTKESEGALLIFFPDEKLPPLMIRKDDGASLYATRDLATDIYRKDKYGDDVVIINEVGIEQELYMRQLYEAEEMLGIFPKNQRVHIKHGHYRFPDGKMSTRKGNVIWLEEVLDKAVELASKINRETSEEVGLGAVRFNDLKRSAEKFIDFNWDEVMRTEGDSGPYLQYTFARCHSLKVKSQMLNVKSSTDYSLPAITSIDRLLYRFPEVVESAAREYVPHYLCTYLLELAGAFNSYYGGTKIIDEDDLEGSVLRLAKAEAVGQVIKNGLQLLGIKAPDRM